MYRIYKDKHYIEICHKAARFILENKNINVFYFKNNCKLFRIINTVTLNFLESENILPLICLDDLLDKPIQPDTNLGVPKEQKILFVSDKLESSYSSLNNYLKKGFIIKQFNPCFNGKYVKNYVLLEKY